MLVGRGRAKCTVTNAQMRCEKTRQLRVYPPKNVWKGPRGDCRGINSKFQSFPIFRGARQEARMRDGKAGQNHPVGQPGNINGGGVVKKSPHTVIYTCVLHFVQYG